MSTIARMFTPSKSDNQSGAQYNQTYNEMTTGMNTVVDSTSAANPSMSALGRAALINTSPSGVQGTDPSQRYRLLGN